MCGGNETDVSKSRARKQERGIWQRRFFEHTSRDEVDLKRCVDYSHVNPLKHGRFVAGSGHQIIAPVELAAQDVSHIIVLNPAYADEIQNQARSVGCSAVVLSESPLSSTR